MKISVAVCTYNGEKYIEEQLNSILDQNLKVDEIVLCDDRSTDDTFSIVQKTLENSGVFYRIEKNAENLMVTKNFEKSASLCTGDYIFFADQDDIWEKDKTEKMIAAFGEKDDGTVMVFSDAKVVDGDGKFVMPSLYKKGGTFSYLLKDKDFTDGFIRLNNTVYGCTMAVKRDFLSAIFPFVESPANHDGWICACAPLFGKTKFIQDALISYRIHGGNLVGSLGGNGKWDKIIAKQDEFDRRFALQELRSIRISLMSEAVDRFKGQAVKRNLKEYKKCIRLYNDLCFIKNNPEKAKGVIIKSLLSGRYKYRLCDRGSKNGLIRQVKIAFADISFMKSNARRKADK